jgi:hypothetical protein
LGGNQRPDEDKEEKMTFLADLKRDYKATSIAYKKAAKVKDKKLMQSLAHDLVRIADAMEGEQ